jgi:hypothetical protein
MGRKRLFNAEEMRARRSAEMRRRRLLAARQEQDEPGKSFPVVVHSKGPVEFVQPPRAVLVDRAYRAKLAEFRDATSQFFNDPLPGYSALDQRYALRRV